MKFKWKRFAGLVLAGTLLTGVVAHRDYRSNYR